MFKMFKFCLVVLLALLVSGSNKNHRFQVLTDEGADANDDLEQYERTADSRSDSSKALKLKGKVRTSMFYISATANLKINLVCSPLAVYLILAKIGFGASSNAKKEIEHAIGEEFDEDVEHNVRKTIKKLENLAGVSIHIGNRIFVSKNVELKHSYIEKVEKAFKNSIIPIDFSNQNKAAKIINSWVSTLTKNKIKSIVEPQDLPNEDDMALICVNAIHFKGVWKYKFDLFKSTESYFHTSAGRKVVNMMRGEHMFDYLDSSELRAQLIKLPFKEEEASMLVVLPHKENDLENLFDRLIDKPTRLAKAISQMKTKRVNIMMPSFKMPTTMNLAEEIKLIGINDIFKEGGLTHMTESKKLVVKKATQKIVIEINEKGGEASEATAIGIQKISYKMPDAVMRADRPFMFMILALGEQLFSGVYVGLPH